jgi:hypothetical protein
VSCIMTILLDRAWGQWIELGARIHSSLSLQQYDWQVYCIVADESCLHLYMTMSVGKVLQEFNLDHNEAF